MLKRFFLYKIVKFLFFAVSLASTGIGSRPGSSVRSRCTGGRGGGGRGGVFLFIIHST